MGVVQESCSSSEEDGDAEWRAAIDSVALDFGLSPSNDSYKPTHFPKNPVVANKDLEKEEKSTAFKLSQLKAQNLLHDRLDKSLVFVSVPNPVPDNNPQEDEAGIRLFRGAPPGIIFDPVDTIPKQRKRPRIVPGEEIDEKSKKFERQIRSVAVDGVEIMASAKDRCQKSLARFEAKDIKSKEAAKKEEERVAGLKKVRGERWLPSMAKEMQGSLNKIVSRN